MWPKPQFPADLVIFAEKILNVKLHFLCSGRSLVMGDPIHMNVDVFWETFVGFLKIMALQLIPKYSQSYVNLNVKNRPKFNST